MELQLCHEDEDFFFMQNSTQYFDIKGQNYSDDVFNGLVVGFFNIIDNNNNSKAIAGQPVVPGGTYQEQIMSHYQHSKEMKRLKYYSYGIVLPAICFMGIVGNILNLIVLTRPTMQGPAYVYMRGIYI